MYDFPQSACGQMWILGKFWFGRRFGEVRGLYSIVGFSMRTIVLSLLPGSGWKTQNLSPHKFLRVRCPGNFAYLDEGWRELRGQDGEKFPVRVEEEHFFLSVPRLERHQVSLDHVAALDIFVDLGDAVSV